MALFLFLLSGRITYWQGFLYLSINIIMMLVSLLFIANNPELIKERLKPGPGTKSWDKIYWVFSTISFLLTLVIASLDAGRIHNSSYLPLYFYIIASGLFIIGYLIFIWARSSNAFFSTVVRIQSDRGHQICTSGPYRFIRHPGYAGGIAFTLATPLVLGSLWALIPSGLSIILIIIRTILEDNTLENELEGYKDYKTKVKKLLIPHIF